MPLRLNVVLPMFIVVRVRRSTKKQPSNSVTDTCQGSSNISSAQSESWWRQASDMAQTSLPLLQTATGAIPLAGPPIQAAISGLLMILQNIDVRAYLVVTTFLEFKAYHTIEKASERGGYN